MRAWICSSVSSTDLISPGYSSAGCAGVIAEEIWATSTACHVERPNNQRQRPFRPARAARSARRRAAPRSVADRAMGSPTATPPCPRQAVTSASTPRICLSVSPRRAAGQQPAADHPASNRVGQPGQGPVLQPRTRPRLGQRLARRARRSSRCPPATRSRCGPAPRPRRRPARPRAAAAPPERSRARVKRRSVLCGSCHAVRPSSRARLVRHRTPHPQQRPAPRRIVRAHPGDRAHARSRGPGPAAPSRPGRRACAPSSTGPSR